MKLTKQKVYDKIWYKLVRLLQSTPVYLYIYRSYWHYLFHPKRFYEPTGDIYYGARPNPGAGIGHQMANWIDGYYWATHKLHLKFAHFPFSTKQWDDFLGFGYGEASALLSLNLDRKVIYYAVCHSFLKTIPTQSNW